MGKKKQQKPPATEKHRLSEARPINLRLVLLVRAGYTIFAWFILAHNVNSNGFFLAMFCFVTPILIDCCDTESSSAIPVRFRLAEIIFLGALMFMSLLGISGVYALKGVGETARITAVNFIGLLPSFSIGEMWWILSSVPFVTALDWFFSADFGNDAKK